MDNLQALTKTIRSRLLLFIFLENLLLIGVWWAVSSFDVLPGFAALAITLLLTAILTPLIASGTTKRVMEPLTALWQAILHLSPTEHGIAAPKVEDLKVGRELVANLTAQIYQLADVTTKARAANTAEAGDLHHNFIANNLPLPFFVLNEAEIIQFANQAAANYIGIPADDLIGKNVYMALDMSFPSEDTYDTWLKQVKVSNATASSSWERVRLNVRDNHPTRLFDLAAYYNRDNTAHMESLLVLFDHTKQYSQDDQAVSFVALSVHELRTPLTLLRGYIEVFEEELEGKITPELDDFMQKMSAQTEQLTAFVNNILNVARVEEDQLQFKLQSEDWAEVLKSALDGINLRAKVRGIEIQSTIAPGLPAVGVDRLSIHEVINNLIDNAIKYSSESKIIKVDAHLNKEGMVETSVQDFGLGISPSIMPNLFTKFYRDHRNRAQIGGTGLGLFLSKTIVSAHGGVMTVNSKEGQGSTFSFTVTPYSQLTDELKKSENKEIIRGAHGWIKNHSLYRR
jgi:signal transduction histidine kinase